MANNNQEQEEKGYKYFPEDIEIYRPIALAPELLEKKDMGGLVETILKFFENLGVKEERYREGLVESIYASPEGLEAFVKDNLENKYQKALYNQKIKDLRELYSDLFEKFYSEENIAKVDKVFNSDETYESLVKRYTELGEIAQSKTDNFSDEQKKKAQKELKELNKVVMRLQEFENIKLYELRGPINEESLKKKLNEMYKEEKRQEGEEQSEKVA